MGISDWFDTNKKPKIAGERIAVMSPQAALTPDAQLKDTPVVLPDPQKNTSWPEAGYDSGNLVPHLAADGNSKQIWSVSAGDGSNDEAPLTSPPVVEEGTIYVIDADSTVSAFSTANGGAKVLVDEAAGAAR